MQTQFIFLTFSVYQVFVQDRIYIYLASNIIFNYKQDFFIFYRAFWCEPKWLQNEAKKITPKLHWQNSAQSLGTFVTTLGICPSVGVSCRKGEHFYFWTKNGVIKNNA